jgi:WD40 repeat protein/serine/threonine protein kinase
LHSVIRASFIICNWHSILQQFLGNAMTAEWDSEAYAILAQVARIESSEERTAYLDEACGGDHMLRERVERLLNVYQRAGSFLDSPVVPASKGNVSSLRYNITDAPIGAHKTIGAQIGPYKILQDIGEGGFGVVYMAEQQRPVRRKVALKIIKPGMDSREVIARFEAEQQALAMMDHPNIARVLDAGTTDNGHPYFAMELVKGVPITEYCDKNNMTLPKRLDLFVTVCRAIQHAHQKGVIHRDIKPSNIMVTLHDGQPVPKVIDFGVAKAINQQLTEKTLFTHYGQMIGTPQYMSPEQSEMSGLEVDTRSDIYSLGVLLYEMLTATTPVTAEQLRATGIAEIQRAIREEEPPTPSTRLSTLGDQLTIVASHRQTDAGKLRQLLRGELDWIVMKSLDKDRSRRYETASAFASDVEAYLHDEPVQARPPSVGYLLGKAIRKHRLLAVTSAIVALILLAATAISCWQAIRAYDQSQIANNAKEDAEANLVRARASEMDAKNQAHKAKTAQLAADRLRDEFSQKYDEFSRKSYVAEMDLVSKANAVGRWREMNQRLERQHSADASRPAALRKLRGFDWHHWWLAGHLHQDMIYDLTPKWNLIASPDGKTVAVSVWPYITRLYRAKPRNDGSSGCEAVLVSELSDSKGIPSFSADGKFVVTWSTDGRNIKIWNTEDGSLARTLGHFGKITATTFSPAQSVPIFAAGNAEGKIMAWDASTWQLMDTITLVGAVRGLAFASNGDAIIAVVDSGDVLAYDVATREVIDVLSSHKSSQQIIASTPDAKFLAIGDRDGNIQLWDKNLEPIASLSAGAPVASLAFSTDGKRLVAGTSKQNSILVWNLGAQSHELLATIRGHLRTVTGVAFVPNADWVWSASMDLSIRIWDLEHCEPFHTLDFKSPEGSRLAYSDADTLMIVRDGDEIRRLDIGNGERMLPRWVNGQKYTSVAISSDGKVVAGIAENVVYVWGANAPNSLPSSCDLGNLDLHWNRAYPPPLAVTSHGPTVALPYTIPNTSNSGIVAIDVGTGEVRCRIPPGTDSRAKARSVFSPNGHRLVVHRGDRSELWDITADPPNLEYSFQWWTYINCAAFSPDGQFLAIVGESEDILLCDTTRQTEISLTGHTNEVNSLAFSPDSSFLVSGSNDHTVGIWDTEAGERRSTLTGHRTPVTSVAVSPNRDSIASRSTDGTIRIWKAATTEDVEKNVDDVLARVTETRGLHQELSGALSSLDTAIEVNPNNWKLSAKRGDIHRLQRNWNDAIDDYSKAIKLKRNDGLLFKRRAEMHLRVNQRSQAIDDFVAAIRHSPLMSSKKYLDEIRSTLNLGDEIVPESAQWHYTTTAYEAWKQNTFDDSDWSIGQAPFGLDTTYLDFSSGRSPNTLWWDKDIWLRVTFRMEDDDIDKPLILNAYVNDYAEVFLNGIQAAQKEVHRPSHWWEGVVEVASDAKLKRGENVLAVHCQNRVDYGYGKINVGLYRRADEDSAFETVLQRSLQHSPNRPQLHAALADQYVRRRQWKEARDCFDILVELSPNKAEAWLQAATLSVYTGDLKRYHQLCGKMLGRFAETSNAQAAEKIAKACLLAPPTEADMPAIREMLGKARTLNPGLWDGWFMPFTQVATALAEYRSDNHQAAIEWAEKSIAKTSGGVPSALAGGTPVFRLALGVKALAHARLGERELASKEAAKLKRFVQQQSPLYTGDQLYTNWQDWLICEILLREVAQEIPENKH